VPSPRLSVERLCNVIGKGHSGAPHNCIIASYEARGLMDGDHSASLPAAIRA
jgi:hypothetical protein